MSKFKGANVLVTGGTGMIGRPLVNQLLDLGANVHVVSLDKPLDMPDSVSFRNVDLRFYDKCLEVCQNMDYVFNLVGVKGSPKMCAEQPVDFMVPMLQFNTNMMDAAYKSGVKWYLFTSSVGVYSPAQVFYEDSVWSTFPSPNDRFAGWAKRIGELQAEAYAIQYGWNNVSIVRPANVYGPWDNFDPQNAMVVPSLIRKAFENDILNVWGDGSAVRDFIFSKDVALGMLHAVENEITEPLNLGSGNGHSISDVVESIVEATPRDIKVDFDVTKPTGDAIRLMDMSRACDYGFETKTGLREGIAETIQWFVKHRDIIDERYNAFKS